MRQWRNRLGNWFFQLENEILLPFLAVGIIVLGGFGVISFYNGYTIEKMRAGIHKPGRCFL